MKAAFLSLCGSTILVVSSAQAHAQCSPGLGDNIAGADRLVASLRPVKPGQMRVFALDGSEYGAGQVHWMKGQLRFVSRACALGDDASADSHLQGVVDLLKAHRR